MFNIFIIIAGSVLFIYFLIKIYLKNRFNFIGIRIGNKIHTFTFQIYSPGILFDIVFMRRKSNVIILYKLFQCKREHVQLTLIPVGHRLIHKIKDRQHSISYEPGTPFSVTEGELFLQRRKRKGMGFVFENIKNGKSWPIN